LLKPFNNTRFEQALGRAKQRIREHRHHPARPDRVAVKGTGQVWFVRLSEIDWIEAADYYACLHVGARTHLLRRSLMELERELQGSVFCRIHRSTIVNLERVRALATNADGDYDVLLEDRTSLPVSRRYRKRLQEQLAERSVKIK
jgi:two-component system, LytTR family, response regulator